MRRRLGRPIAPPPLSTPVWDLELFSALEMLTILENRFSIHFMIGHPENLRAKLELAAW